MRPDVTASRARFCWLFSRAALTRRQKLAGFSSNQLPDVTCRDVYVHRCDQRAVDTFPSGVESIQRVGQAAQRRVLLGAAPLPCSCPTAIGIDPHADRMMREGMCVRLALGRSMRGQNFRG